MKPNHSEIIASTARKADGWAAVLEFPNGGRQVFAQRFGSMESAQREAKNLLRVRLTYPDGVIPDPAPHTLMDLGEQYYDKGAAVETQMAIRHPNCI